MSSTRNENLFRVVACHVNRRSSLWDHTSLYAGLLKSGVKALAAACVS